MRRPLLGRTHLGASGFRFDRLGFRGPRSDTPSLGDGFRSPARKPSPQRDSAPARPPSAWRSAALGRSISSTRGPMSTLARSTAAWSNSSWLVTMPEEMSASASSGRIPYFASNASGVSAGDSAEGALAGVTGVTAARGLSSRCAYPCGEFRHTPPCRHGSTARSRGSPGAEFPQLHHLAAVVAGSGQYPHRVPCGKTCGKTVMWKRRRM